MDLKVLNIVIDVLFGLDILVIFNSAYYNLDFVVVESHGKIACNYLKGWFLLDFFAIFPFDVVVK